MRTNIVINNQLMQSAIMLGGLPTKKATIEAALKLYVQLHQQATLRQYRGKLKWEGDLAQMRTDK
jgi:Arc/MetJ family transcription regulator